MSFNDEGRRSRVWTWHRETLRLCEGATHFGYSNLPGGTLTCKAGTFELVAGLFYSVPGNAFIKGGEGFVVSTMDFRGMFLLGGPIEPEGRLHYIDGCSDSILISPQRKGDPCLNFLFLPPGIDQTQHTHPSHRVGLVVSGAGHCVTLNCTYPLGPGMLFVLSPNTLHSFHTLYSHLRIVVYHPDSDFGPTHDDHPMVNQTIIDGISASSIREIRTRG